MSDSLGAALHSTVDEGTMRLTRTWPALLATGAVGGIDVSVGVLASLLVTARTDNELLGALAFSIGFIALTLANSELFTENFMVPLAAVAARKARWPQVGRLWFGTAATNLVGGGLIMGLIALTFPDVADHAAETGLKYLERGLSVGAFTSAVLAGVVMTLMTWMEHGTGTTGGRIVSAIVAGFVLKYGVLSHVIVASLEVFAGIFGGQSGYTIGTWLSQVWFWALGNAVGGIGLVTVMRLVQIGPQRIIAEQRRPTTADDGKDHGTEDHDTEDHDTEDRRA